MFIDNKNKTVLSTDQIETLKLRQPMKLQAFYALTPTYNKR